MIRLSFLWMPQVTILAFGEWIQSLMWLNKHLFEMNLRNLLKLIIFSCWFSQINCHLIIIFRWKFNLKFSCCRAFLFCCQCSHFNVNHFEFSCETFHRSMMCLHHSIKCWGISIENWFPKSPRNSRIAMAKRMD